MIADIKPASIDLFHACVDVTFESIRLATSVARFASSSLAELRREVDVLLAKEFGAEPKADVKENECDKLADVKEPIAKEKVKSDERSKCIKDLRTEAGKLRKMPYVDHLENTDRFRLAAGYELAADLLETPV